MTDMALADRVYFVASSAYVVENSHTALTLFRDNPGIGNMVMEILTIKQKTLRSRS